MSNTGMEVHAWPFHGDESNPTSAKLETELTDSAANSDLDHIVCVSHRLNIMWKLDGDLCLVNMKATGFFPRLLDFAI